MHVLIDTNIYLSDITFSRPEFIALKNYLHRTNHKILLPDIVKLEIEKNIKTISEKEVRKLFDLAARKLKVIAQVPSADDISEAIKNNLDSSILNSRTKKGIPSDRVDLSELIERSLDEKPPFKSNGRGFRDALIWYSLISYLDDNPEDVIAFISNNTDDFGKGSLKQTLSEELKEKSLSDRVFYFNDLADFLTQWSEPLAFLNEDYVRQGIDDIAMNHASTIDEGDLEIQDTTIEDYEINSFGLDKYVIDNFYIYSSTARYYEVYVDVTYLFVVDISGMEYMYNPYAGDWDWYPNEESTTGFVDAEYKLKIDKHTQEIIEVDYF